MGWEAEQAGGRIRPGTESEEEIRSASLELIMEQRALSLSEVWLPNA